MSDNNINNLLAQLKTDRNRAAKKSSPPQSTSKLSIAQMLDKLSKEIQSGKLRPDRELTKAIAPKQQVRNLAKERERLNALIDTDYRRQAHKREQKLAEIERQKEAELAKIKRQEEARIAEEKRRQQELIEAQRREELRERRRKEALREKAQQWLKNLNPRSEEGKWFEEFSYSYEDKLQAAIDYLEAMRETGLNY